MGAVAGHGQLTIDGQLVVHLTDAEVSVLISACRLGESSLEAAGFTDPDDGMRGALRAVAGRLAEVLR